MSVTARLLLPCPPWLEPDLRWIQLQPLMIKLSWDLSCLKQGIEVFS